MGDDVRIRAEGACEALEAAAARVRQALDAYAAGRPCVLPELQEDEALALVTVRRLEAGHASVSALEEAQAALEAARAEWVRTFRFTPSVEQLPVRFSAVMWVEGLWSPSALLRLGISKVPVVITARELVVRTRVIPFSSIRSVSSEAGVHVLVTHRRGTVSLTPAEHFEVVLGLLRSVV